MPAKKKLAAFDNDVVMTIATDDQDSLDLASEVAAALSDADETSQELAATEQSASDQRIAQLESTVMELSTQFGLILSQLTDVQKLALTNTKNIRALDHNVRVIDADPVVNLSVPKMPKSPLMEMQYESPEPTALVARQTPTHMSERKPNAEVAASSLMSNDPALNALNASAARTRSIKRQ